MPRIEAPGRALRAFLKLESAGGLLLLAAALLACAAANSGLASLYRIVLDFPLGMRFGVLALEKPLLFWINDGLMAVFFLLVGLEIKREVLEGELSSLRLAALPAIAALGGMIVPALVYLALNAQHPENLAGWAIPAATDIAFAVGVLTLCGRRVPGSLKVFLLALAILDDLGAILIIAVFYSHGFAALPLILAGFFFLCLLALNRLGVASLAPYLLLGALLWLAVLQSGIHATLAGVLLAFAIPLKTPAHPVRSPLKWAEQALHPWVTFGIMPLFAFANAGVSLEGLTGSILLQPLTLGIALGLFLGKQAGVLLAAALGKFLGLCRLPQDVSWRSFYGVAVLAGIGFTMSLFIGTLAFGAGSVVAGVAMTEVRLGVLGGSLFSALWGWFFIRYLTPPPPRKPSAA